MRRAAFMVALAALFWAGPTLAEPVPYTPMVGDTLRYAISNGDSATTRVIRTREESGKILATLEQTLQHGGERRIERLTMVRTGQGIALGFPETGSKKTLLVCYLTQAGVNDTWTAQKGSFRDTDGELVEYKVFARLEAIETVTVRAGTFPDCYRVAYRTSMSEENTLREADMLFWFKPELGIIKTRSVHGETVTETELVDFETSTYGKAK